MRCLLWGRGRRRSVGIIPLSCVLCACMLYLESCYDYNIYFFPARLCFTTCWSTTLPSATREDLPRGCSPLSFSFSVHNHGLLCSKTPSLSQDEEVPRINNEGPRGGAHRANGAAGAPAQVRHGARLYNRATRASRESHN